MACASAMCRATERAAARPWGVEYCVLLVLALCPLVVFFTERLPQKEHPLLRDALRRFREADTLGFNAYESGIESGFPVAPAHDAPAAAAAPPQPVPPPRARPVGAAHSPMKTRAELCVAPMKGGSRG